jgi:hypothetical protein
MTILSIRYNPRHQYQLLSSDPYGKYNCAAYATAMALDGATLGGLRVTGKLIRHISTEPIPDPNSPGLNLKQMVAVSKQLRVPMINMIGGGWSVLIFHLDAGRYIVLNGDYDQMGVFSEQPSFIGDHSILVVRRYTHGKYAGYMLIHDPLAKSWRRVLTTTIHRYAEKFNPNISFAVTRITPNYAKG